MKKKVLAFACAMMVTASLTACGINEVVNGTAPSSSQRQGELANSPVSTSVVHNPQGNPHKILVAYFTYPENTDAKAIHSDKYDVMSSASLKTRDGVAIGSKKSVEEAGVPLLDGGPDAVKSDAFDSAVQALQTLPRSLLNQLNKVDAESSNNIQPATKDGSKVKWGTGEDSDYKAEVLNSLVQGLKDSGGASVYDVSSPDRPVTK